MKSNVAHFALALLLGRTLSSAAPLPDSGLVSPVFRAGKSAMEATRAAENAVGGLRVGTKRTREEDEVLTGNNPFSRHGENRNHDDLVPGSAEWEDELARKLAQKLRQGEISPKTPPGYRRVKPRLSHSPSSSSSGSGKEVQVRKPASAFDQAMAFFTIQGAITGLALAIHGVVNNTKGYENVKKVEKMNATPAAGAAGSAAPPVQR